MRRQWLTSRSVRDNECGEGAWTHSSRQVAPESDTPPPTGLTLAGSPRGWNKQLQTLLAAIKRSWFLALFLSFSLFHFNLSPSFAPFSCPSLFLTSLQSLLLFSVIPRRQNRNSFDPLMTFKEASGIITHTTFLELGDSSHQGQ